MVKQRSSKSHDTGSSPVPPAIMNQYIKEIYQKEFDQAKLDYYETKDELELWILTLHKSGMTYGNIQNTLGSPSKKQIRNVLLKHGRIK